MKLLTLNFLTCAVKACKTQVSSTAAGMADENEQAEAEAAGDLGGAPFPLHVRDAELEIVELEFNPLFMRNILARVEWDAMKSVVAELGLALPPAPPTAAAAAAASAEQMALDGTSTGAGAAVDAAPPAAHDDDEYLHKLHRVLIETQITSGKLVCGRCGHEYAIREGIANFLLPPHLV